MYKTNSIDLSKLNDNNLSYNKRLECYKNFIGITIIEAAKSCGMLDEHCTMEDFISPLQMPLSSEYTTDVAIVLTDGRTVKATVIILTNYTTNVCSVRCNDETISITGLKYRITRF